MKLQNKKTGEIVEYVSFKAGAGKIAFYVFDTAKHYYYNSLAELNEEWEDYKEPPKVFWYIEGDGDIHHIGTELCDELEIHTMKRIGNYFETKEEAEKAVEKLRAYKRLKDRGFKFDGYNACSVDYDIDEQYRKYISKDLELLFGGEE